MKKNLSDLLTVYGRQPKRFKQDGSLYVRMPKPLKRQLTQISLETGVSVSNMIRRAIVNILENYDKERLLEWYNAKE